MLLDLTSLLDFGRHLMNSGLALVLLLPLAIAFFELRDWLAPRLRRWWRSRQEPKLYDGNGHLIDPDRMPEFAVGSTPRLGERSSALSRHVRQTPRLLVNSVTGSSLHSNR